MKHAPFLIAAALLVSQSLTTPSQAQFDPGLGLYETEGEEAEDSTATSVTPATSEYRKQNPLDEDHNYGDEGGKDIMADPEEDED